MKLNLPSADALLTASAAGSALLAGGFALLPQELHESAWKAETAYSKDSHRHLYEGLAASAGGGAIIGAVALGDDSKAAKLCTLKGLGGAWLLASATFAAHSLGGKAKPEAWPAAALSAGLGALLLAKGLKADEKDLFE